MTQHRTSRHAQQTCVLHTLASWWVIYFVSLDEREIDISWEPGVHGGRTESLVSFKEVLSVSSLLGLSAILPGEKEQCPFSLERWPKRHCREGPAFPLASFIGEEGVIFGYHGFGPLVGLCLTSTIQIHSINFFLGSPVDIFCLGLDLPSRPEMGAH